MAESNDAELFKAARPILQRRHTTASNSPRPMVPAPVVWKMVMPTGRRSSLADTSERANEFRSTFHGSTRLKRSISDATSLGHRSGDKPSFALHNVDASSVRRAQRLREVDEQRYQKFRNFFKNYEPELAGEIYARAAFPREQLFTWVNYIVSPQVLRCLKGSKDTQQQILELLMVAAAMAKYGEGELVAKDKRGDLDALQNIQLHTYTVYSSTRSQSNRSNAKLATNQEASRVKLEFLLRINERLPKERRVTEELLREILSCASTISIQPKDQSAREAFTEDSGRSSPGHDRCVQIALRVQSEWFQDAILKINGQYLYDATRQILSKVDVSVWDARKDKAALTRSGNRQSERSEHVNNENGMLNLRYQASKATARPPMVARRSTVTQDTPPLALSPINCAVKVPFATNIRPSTTTNDVHQGEEDGSPIVGTEKTRRKLQPLGSSRVQRAQERHQDPLKRI